MAAFKKPLVFMKKIIYFYSRTLSEYFQLVISFFERQMRQREISVVDEDNKLPL